MTKIRRTSTDRTGERGVALVLTLFLVTIMSVLAVSLMSLSQTESYATMNYRMMSQARYGAESGVHAAANYLLNGYTAVQPGTVGDPFGNYNTAVSPVTFNNLPVVLSANPAVASNYPVAAVIAAFNAAAQGTMNAGAATVSYKTSATLMSMRQVGIGGGIIQTWKITADGTVSGARTATVEVGSTLDALPVPGVGYGVYATGDSCGSIQLQGNGSTDSYDSSTYNAAAGALSAANGGVAASGGNVGTNGNMSASGSSTINGDLYTPRTGVGTCHNGGGGVAGDALTEGGNATLNGTIKQLPAPLATPTPALPNPLPPTNNVTVNGGTTCAGLGLTAPTCTGVPGNLTISLVLGPVSLGNLTVSGGATVTFTGSATMQPTSNLNVNSIVLSGNSNIKVSPGTYVTMDVAGKNPGNPDLATPIDLTGGNTITNSYDATHFQIQYAGTGQVKMIGNPTSAVLVDAPNAAVTMQGNANFYGAIISGTFVDTGNGNLYYDRNLSKSVMAQPGPPWLTTFSWKKA